MPLNKIPNGPIKIDKKALESIGSDGKAIIDAAKAYIEAEVAIQPNTLQYSLLKQDGDFAAVGVGVPEGGGYQAILKHVYGIWVVIVRGQDMPGQEIGKKYGLPEGWYSKEY